jgi:hypothetical protein
MSFQRTPYRSVVAAILARLRGFGLNSTWVGIKMPTEMWLGDYLIALSPGAASVDEGTTTGTGVCGSILRRPVKLVLMSRSYEDEGERAERALYEHLDREEQMLTALHLWMPTDINGIIVEPFRLANISDPEQVQGVIKTVLTFEATYPAWLQYGTIDQYNMLWTDGSANTTNWGVLPEDTILNQ